MSAAGDAASSRTTRWDIEDALAHLRRDPDLRPLIREVGSIELKAHKPYFWTLCTAILAQQVSGAAARTIIGRVEDLFDGGRRPRPSDLLSVSRDDLRGAGVSRQKSRYLHALAEAFQDGLLSNVRFSRLDDDEIVERLTSVPGVGQWTAEMFLMFSMRRPDVFPTGDLGIRRGMERFFGLSEVPAMVERAQPWRPYRTVASVYLWRAQDAIPI